MMRKNYWAVKHDKSTTRIYRIWIGMKARCYNKNSVPYPHYGARGITVCDEWTDKEHGFMNFYNWSVNHGYEDNLSIDRINVDGNYCPDNCRWADNYIQSVNRHKKKSESGYIGISKHNNCDTYYGRVKVHRKVICTGSAKTALEAAILRDQFIIDHNLENKLNGVLNGNF